MGGGEVQRRGRHRRPQGRAGDRGRDHRPRTPSSASRSWCSRRRSTACRASSRPASAWRSGPVVEEARAHDLLGRHHPGRRRREAPQPEVSVPQHRQRVRGGHVLAARHQALEGPVQAHRRHQSRLFLRPQQHGRLHRPAEALQHRARGRHRAVAEGRHHGPDQPRRRAQGGQARPDLLLAAVCRPAGVHEAGARRRAHQGHQAGVPGRRAGSTR